MLFRSVLSSLWAIALNFNVYTTKHLRTSLYGTLRNASQFNANTTRLTGRFKLQGARLLHAATSIIYSHTHLTSARFSDGWWCRESHKKLFWTALVDMSSLRQMKKRWIFFASRTSPDSQRPDFVEYVQTLLRPKHPFTAFLLNLAQRIRNGKKNLT